MRISDAKVMRLRALVDEDPGALVRVLQFFQARNVVPSRVYAWRFGCDCIGIEVDVPGLAPEAFRLIVAKINQVPTVLTAFGCD